MKAKDEQLLGRMGEYMHNYQAAKKPKPTGNRVAYDYASKRVVGYSRHRKCTVASPAYRENFDQIFRKT